MSTNYKINISMDPDTVKALTNSGYRLYAFKGVQTTAGGGVPLVWFSTSAFATSTAIAWSESYVAYDSFADSIPNGSVTATNQWSMNLGQVVTINNASGLSDQGAQNGGEAGAITIKNKSGSPFTAGIGQKVGTDTNTLCAFPLYGTSTLEIAPIEQVLLMFSTQSYNTGTVIYKAFTDGVLVDLTLVSERTVNFDINKGWIIGTNTWEQGVDQGAYLTPLLIEGVGTARPGLVTRISAGKNMLQLGD